jgi:amino acid adenylation domain-containing protein
MDRGTELAIAILAILKAGGSFVPLDPTEPAERLAHFISDAHIRVLLTAGNLPAIRTDVALRVIALDVDSDAAEPGAEVDPRADISPENIAYTIYTSGATGRPGGGVMISHSAIVNRLLWMQSAYGLGPNDRVLQKAPLGSDVSVWELLGPLTCGAAVVLAAPHVQRDGHYLIQLAREQKVTHLHCAPAMLDILLNEPDFMDLPSLKRVICSGAPLPFELQQRFFSHMAAELHKLYGSVETAIDVAAWRCDRQRPGRIVPIGRPVANMTAYILDREFSQVPIGAAGELYFGGPQLARGYVGQPGLTAERFLPNPFSATAGDRLYRTGDLARYAADGAIEFLGQVARPVDARSIQAETRGFVMPALPLERAVAQIWADVLNVPRIGIEDDFFQLGGHSLQVIRVLSRLRDLLSVEVPVAQFFAAPTVGGLAALIAQDFDRDGQAAKRAEAALAVPGRESPEIGGYREPPPAAPLLSASP